jgi:drug/metabolite transporter (DMT)-like permease
MTAFLLLCLVSRLAYAFNDVLTGQLARLYGPIEVAAWRGVTLAVTMAPLLRWVPAPAWGELAARWPEVVALVGLTGVANILSLQSARLLPFGLRAAFMIAGTAVAGVVLGAVVLGERLTPLQLALAALLVAAAMAAAPGRHATHEIQPRLVPGTLLIGTAGILLAVVALFGARLSRASDPLLVAWVWEAGAGFVLLPLALWRAWRGGWPPGLAGRVWRIGLASAPTVVGSGATMLALKAGALGLWAAVGGTHILFSVALGRWWHGEPLGVRRLACFATAAAAVGGLAWWGQ